MMNGWGKADEASALNKELPAIRDAESRRICLSLGKAYQLAIQYQIESLEDIYLRKNYTV